MRGFGRAGFRLIWDLRSLSTGAPCLWGVITHRVQAVPTEAQPVKVGSYKLEEKEVCLEGGILPPSAACPVLTWRE